MARVPEQTFYKIAAKLDSSRIKKAIEGRKKDCFQHDKHVKTFSMLAFLDSSFANCGDLPT